MQLIYYFVLHTASYVNAGRDPARVRLVEIQDGVELWTGGAASALTAGPRPRWLVSGTRRATPPSLISPYALKALVMRWFLGLGFHILRFYRNTY